MIEALTKHIEFDTLFARMLTVANCSSSEELASRLDVECSLFDQCRKTGSVPSWLLVVASYKLDVSLRCLYDTDCNELTTTKKKLEAMAEQLKQFEAEAAQKYSALISLGGRREELQKEIAQKDAELLNISRVREAFILEMSAAKDKLSAILESVSLASPD